MPGHARSRLFSQSQLQIYPNLNVRHGTAEATERSCLQTHLQEAHGSDWPA